MIRTVLLVTAISSVAVADSRLKVEAPPDPKAVVAAKQIIDDALVAKGGKQRLAAIKTIKLVATGTTTVQSKTVAVEMERVFVLPDRMRIDATLAQSIKVIVAVNGTSGWQLLPSQNGIPTPMTLTASDLKSIDFERWRDPELILLKASEPNAKVSAAPDENMTKHANSTLDGRPHAVVKVSSPTGTVVSIYIDKATKQVSRLAYDDNGTTTRDDYSDYRGVGGVKVAFKRSSDTKSRTTKLELKSAAFDEPISAALFRMPSAPAPAP